MINGYEIHPAADVLPLMTGDRLQSLTDDIKTHGLLKSVVTWSEGGLVVDGRNRLVACEQLGIEPHFRAVEFADDDAVIDYVVSANLERRHLTPSQLGLAAGRLANMKHGGNRGNQHTVGKMPNGTLPTGTGAATVSIRKAAKKMGVSRRTAARGKRVVSHGAPEVVAAVDSGDLSLGRAAAITQGTTDHKEQVAMMNDPSLIPPPKKTTKNERMRHKVGIHIARQAIGLLKTILRNDTKRKEGLKLVQDWVNNELGEVG